MARTRKQLSNPFSTGGGGVNFETRVEALFAVLMLTGGVPPCLPQWPITKIKLQGKHAGYETDDFIVFTKDPNTEEEAKLLAQIKHSIHITKGDKTFGEVIHAGWHDFSNSRLFSPGKDAIALITGPLSGIDTHSARSILELARQSEDVSEFMRDVELVKFSSSQQRDKLKIFRFCLKKSKGADVSDDELWRFLRSFHLLGYDLDTKTGGTLSLLQSLIGQYSSKAPQDLWSRIVDEVQLANQSSGTLNGENLSKDILDAFKEPTRRGIPKELVRQEEIILRTELSQIPYPEELVVAELLGAWSDASGNDKIVIEKLSGSKYADWIGKIRNLLLQPNFPLTFKNGIWNIKERRDTWYMLGPQLFDEHLDRLRDVAVSVLCERDPQFDLKPDERYAASLHAKALTHSHNLRNGVAESLALLGSHPKVLTHCSPGKAESIAVLAVREVLAEAHWVRWATLNDLLPLLAEAAPGEFLDTVDNALNRKPCPFNMVFAQEGTGIMGRNYMTGLLWALETLAWDEEYLTRVIVILGELAAKDPGGTWANRPINSLSTILLPWLPQTCATISKRKAAVETLMVELPDVAWKLLLSLLPSSHQMSSGSRKPAWREMATDDSPKGVTNREYWDQTNAYAELAITVAKRDLSKLTQLIDRLDDLPPVTRDKLLAHLRSDPVVSLPESNRLPLWTELVGMVSKHRQFSDAEWAIEPEVVNEIAAVAQVLSPVSPIYRHQRLFGDGDFDLFEEKGDYEQQSKKLEARRQDAVAEIFDAGGVEAVLEFTKAVESPWRVGVTFGMIAANDVQEKILPGLLESDTKSLAQFAGGFTLGMFRRYGWQWIDNIDTSQWTPSRRGQLLAYLPFTPDAWKRATLLLGEDESPYWYKANANPYETEESIEIAVDRLVQFGRPNAAIRCLALLRHKKQPLDSKQAFRVLMAVLNSSEKPQALDVHAILEVIKALQNDPAMNPDDLFQIEWAFLPLLDRYRGASPRLLEQRLADDPIFFCEVISAVFRSKKEDFSVKEPTEQQKTIAKTAYRLLNEWRKPPGSQKDGTFDGNALSAWLKEVKKSCAESGHLVVALTMVGHVLIHTPPDTDGLWIHHSAAAALNAKEANHMRDGFRTALFNSRGVHTWTAGKEEQEIAKKYRTQAKEVEDRSYHRLANCLRELATSYERDAEREASRHPLDD